jgi:uncharacterized protein
MSPCVRICTVDNTSTYCTTCFRTLTEIQTWQWMTEEEQAYTTAMCELRKLANKLDEYTDNEAKRKDTRVKPCSGHDTQG